MAWEWSHSAEAYDNVRTAIAAMPAEELIEIKLEWLAYCDKRISDEDRQHGEPANFRRTEKRKAYWQGHCEKMGTEHLADDIYDMAENHATCDNGGHDMWVCPYGCHTVPASSEDDESDDEYFAGFGCAIAHSRLNSGEILKQN
jgi:hypothetical protein